ncbi:DUF3421 domain-containing protein [Sphingosinicella sp. YJ22]|uniref:DUF3421 domain-containing protein n=1 Tax=Sphingosinicella sp. YJ22 TaxID=1104780 RepID=UPI00140E6CF3|nr:DUF3421 domain-containing protein [Sphingosinicella sp. YJ22]
MKLAVVAVASLLIATPSLAQVTGASGSNGSNIETGQQNLPEGASEGGRNANGERLICRRVEAGSSSRMSTRRVCLTAREWRERQ